MSSGASPSPSQSQSLSSPDNGGGNNPYPPQRHAGAVGYGPEYGKGAVCMLSVETSTQDLNARLQSTGDKLEGLKEEMKGKVLHKPDLVQHGHDLRTGELKRKQMENDVRINPNRFHADLSYTSTIVGQPLPAGERAGTSGDHRPRRDRSREVTGKHTLMVLHFCLEGCFDYENRLLYTYHCTCNTHTSCCNCPMSNWP